MKLVLSPSAPRLSLVLGALLLALQLLVPAGGAAAGDCPHTPAPGTSERKAIMDALREPVTAELKQSVVFVVAQLGVCGDWAFIEAEPQQPDGRPVDWTKGVYAEAIADDMCGGYVHALLVRQAGRWQVKTHVICATDVPWVGWADQYGAPTALFPQFD